MVEHNAEPAASERDPLDASAAVEPVTIETLQAQLEEARVEVDGQRGQPTSTGTCSSARRPTT